MFAARQLGNSLLRQRTISPGVIAGAVRHLNVHEYVAMELFKASDITTPNYGVASTPEEAEQVFMERLNQPGTLVKDVVIKAQVLSGGRGLGTFKSGFQSGVHIINQPGQARDLAAKMLGHELVTLQAPEGIPCHKVLLMERVSMRSEMYLSILMDRVSQGPLMMVCPRGGTSIEDVAASRPEYVFTQPIDIIEGLRDDQAYRMAEHMGLEEDTEAHSKAVLLMKNLYKMFISCDCTQIEVNPLVETLEGDIVVCDAKVNFDDNAEFRQPDIFASRDVTQEDPREVTAAQHNLNFVGLDGNIGCMVNGAGLAMATMDMIQLKGGSPANFLDVGKGAGASVEQVQKAFEILEADEEVKAILVHIFGGMMRCDTIAKGLLNAVKEIGLSKPIVIRLQGTNIDEAKTLIEASPYRMIVVDDIGTAAEKAVAMAEIVARADNIEVDTRVEGLLGGL